MKILFLEPFFGGSHKEFAVGLQKKSIHEIDLITLPAASWKWRMRSAALLFLEMISRKGLIRYDGIIVSDMMNLAEFKGLVGKALPPVMLYFHENQMTYPLNTGRKTDYQFPFINLTSALAADRIIFNSNTHKDAFFSSIPEVLKILPDGEFPSLSGRLAPKTKVLYPGCDFFLEKKVNSYDKKNGSPPLIIWNHRWEYDKNPQLFFRVLYKLKERGVGFKLAVLGERLDFIPPVFMEAKEKLVDEIDIFGYADSRVDYYKWLGKGHILVSTAFQENFGISVVEAVGMGCFPILPDRLSYPEIMPEEHLNTILYGDERELMIKLEQVLRDSPAFDPLRAELSRAMSKFSWETLIHGYDEELLRLCRDGNT